MSATGRIIQTSQAIVRIGRELNYSRSHVANLLRSNKKYLRARRVNGRWVIPERSEEKLKHLVRVSSGPRYKLGERGPNAP